MRNTNRGAHLPPIDFKPHATDLPEVRELDDAEGWLQWDAAVAWQDSQRGELDPLAAVTLRGELEAARETAGALDRLRTNSRFGGLK